MGRRQLILSVGPRLLGVGERRPCLRVFGGLGLAQHRCERRERLVEPQVVPPLHRHEIAEPHVRHLVQDGLGAALVRRPGHLAAEDVVLQERHGSRVLHRARVELRNEQLVVLAERIRHAEVLVVEAESLFRLGEQSLGVHELRQRRAAEQAQRNVAVLVAVGVVPAGVWTGDQRHQVGAHLRRDDEGVPLGRARVLHTGGGAVGDDLPVRRRRDGHLESRLEVGLVEAREHPLRVGGFELRIQVHLVVDRVDEPVQAFAGVGVAAIGVDDERHCASARPVSGMPVDSS